MRRLDNCREEDNEMNAKAINIFYSSLSESKFNRICGCTSANEIWSTLEVTYEGTSKVNEIQIDLLVHEY